MSAISRREFLRTSAVAATAVTLAPGALRAQPTARKGAFSFVFLGDLHFDRLEHHDMTWVRADKPNDVSQIQNYSRITREITPRLLATVRDVVAEQPKRGLPCAFVLQAGDLVEGLCGSEELAVRQNREALQAMAEARFGVPCLFTKGNHDITGPGAPEAFRTVFDPFLKEQSSAVDPQAGALAGACYTVTRGNAQFAFLDAYQAAESLAWFEAVAAKRTAEHLFVVVHPPVVPYGARSTWHLFASAREKTRREKFLGLLGDHQAIVLGGHIHRYNSLVRTAGRKRFSQFAVSSIISEAAVTAKTVLSGTAAYTGEQVKVEPSFSPANEPERRAIYDAEKPFVTAFEYADLPGYAVIDVDGAKVTARMYSGVSRDLWRTAELQA